MNTPTKRITPIPLSRLAGAGAVSVVVVPALWHIPALAANFVREDFAIPFHGPLASLELLAVAHFFVVISMIPVVIVSALLLKLLWDKFGIHGFVSHVGVFVVAASGFASAFWNPSWTELIVWGTVAATIGIPSWWMTARWIRRQQTSEPVA